MSSHVRVRRVRAAEGPRLRELRLRALTEVPWGLRLHGHSGRGVPRCGVGGARDTGGAGEDTVTYVAEDSDRWVGLVTGSLEDGRFNLFGTFVESPARGRGVGAALVEAVSGWAWDRGATSLYLGVTATNHPAIALYERCGFRPTGTRRPLGHTPTLTVLEMVRDP